MIAYLQSLKVISSDETDTYSSDATCEIFTDSRLVGHC